MITKEIIEDRIENFLGYGNLDSEIWFIGMEEGFGDKKEVNGKRIAMSEEEIWDHLEKTGRNYSGYHCIT